MTKISQLPADSSPTTTDVVPTVDVESNTTKKSTLANLIDLFFSNVPAGSIQTAGLDDEAVTAPKIDFGGAGSGVWWEEIGRTTLTSAGDTITVSGLPVRRNLKIIATLTDTGGTIGGGLRFNNDSGNNYAGRYSVSGAGDATYTSQSSALFRGATEAAPLMATGEVFNIATDEKDGTFVGVSASTAGAANIPNRTDGAFKWANTSDAITRIDLINNGTGDFAIGSEVIVLGHD